MFFNLVYCRQCFINFVFYVRAKKNNHKDVLFKRRRKKIRYNEFYTENASEKDKKFHLKVFALRFYVSLFMSWRIV